MKLIFNLLLGVVAGGAGIRAQVEPGSPIGVMVLAHGGDSAWNRAVESSVVRLRERWPTEIAFGMARSDSMAGALERLRMAGVTKVAVVGLFVSAESFRHRTQFILGLRQQRPPAMGPTMGPAEPISHGLQVALNDRGLVEDRSIGDLLALRAAVASADPANESVMILAHGMGTDSADARLLAAMQQLATRIAEHVPFRQVKPFTLREDWAPERRASEAEIRAVVSEEASAGRRVIAVPLRVFGFGPYGDVLAGLEYRAAEGLLPHPMVSEWLERNAERTMIQAGWLSRVAYDER